MVWQHNRAACLSLVIRAFSLVGSLAVILVLVSVPAGAASDAKADKQYWQAVYQGKRILEI